jgi:hypothetical protein
MFVSCRQILLRGHLKDQEAGRVAPTREKRNAYGLFVGETWRKTTKMGCRMVESIPNVHGFITVTSLLLFYANCIQLLQLSCAHYFTVFNGWNTDHSTSLSLQGSGQPCRGFSQCLCMSVTKWTHLSRASWISQSLYSVSGKCSVRGRWVRNNLSFNGQR